MHKFQTSSLEPDFVTLNKLFNFSVPQFPYLWGEKNSTFFIGKTYIHIKCSEQLVPGM